MQLWKLVLLSILLSGLQCGCAPPDRECRDNEFACKDGSKCLKSFLFCDGRRECKDGSDEIDTKSNVSGIHCRRSRRICILPQNQASKKDAFCTKDPKCDDNEFACQDGSACLPPPLFCDGNPICKDRSDEIKYEGAELNGEILCNGKTGRSQYPCLLPTKYQCDNTTHCVNGIDECLCADDESQRYLDQKCFRCLSNPHTVVPVGQLCDGVFDCPDLSDECLCSKELQPGICSRVDWQFTGDSEVIQSFSCVTSNSSGIDLVTNKNLISRFDCGVKTANETCVISCEETEKFDFPCRGTTIIAKRCDGNPECDHDVYEEECNCPNPPKFCDYVGKEFSVYLDCRISDGTKLLIHGTQICDGVQHCPGGEDEAGCPRRFHCTGGSPFNIDEGKKCDQVEDCDDGSDEVNCSFPCNDAGKIKWLKFSQLCDGTLNCLDGADECLPRCITSAFSDVESMIKSKAILSLMWMLSLFALLGNMAVIGYVSHQIIHGYLEQIDKLSKILVLNLSVSDLLVGIYTTAICIRNSTPGGQYCLHDHEWRSGPACASLGALLVVGSELSLMALLMITLHRSIVIANPRAKSSIRLFCFFLPLTWVGPILLGVMPLIPSLQDDFVDSIWYKENRLFTTINQTEVQNQTHWLLLMRKNTNESVDTSRIGSWSLLKELIREMNPGFEVDRRFGFYSSHGVCLPMWFANQYVDTARGYSLMLIIINFFACVLIFCGNIFIYSLSAKKNTGRSEEHQQKIESAMQKRLTRIILTDSLCWIPVCILAFLQASGVMIPRDIYVVTALILVPINSAVNPVLYSNALGFLWSKTKRICSCMRRKKKAPASCSIGEQDWRGMEEVNSRASDEAADILSKACRAESDESYAEVTVHRVRGKSRYAYKTQASVGVGEAQGES